MEFEIGPWTSFGKEILDQIDELINGNLITDESDLLGMNKTPSNRSSNLHFAQQLNRYKREV